MIGAYHGAISGWQALGIDDSARLDSPAGRLDLYAELRAWHESTIFGARSLGGSYRAQHRLYRQTRLLYNPIPALVGAYVSTIYPGVLSEDAKRLPEGIATAIPLAPDTPADLVAAISQAWRWSNWQAEKSYYVQTGALYGSCLLEVVDDLEAGKVWFRVRVPSEVASVTLDAAGNLKAYVLAYQARDSDGTPYQYRKEWDTERWAEYRDDKRSDGGPNPYGLVPARWLRHRNCGRDFGESPVARGLPMLRAINSQMSQLDDAIGKKAAAPILIGTSTRLESLSGLVKREPTDDFGTAQRDADREDLLIWKAAPDTSVHSLASQIDVSAVREHLADKVARYEAMYPELTYSRELRSMSTLTGPAAARLLADVAAIVYETQSTYDEQLIRASQIAVAIGGMRLADGLGGWAERTRQRDAFDGFDLDSYAAGALDFAILPRPLVPISGTERATEMGAKAAAIKTLTEAGIDLVDALVLVGEDQQRATEIANRRIDAIRRAQTLVLDDTGAAGVMQ